MMTSFFAEFLILSLFYFYAKLFGSTRPRINQRSYEFCTFIKLYQSSQNIWFLFCALIKQNMHIKLS